MNILLVQLDGRLPNLAVMRLSAHHKAMGDTVEFHRGRVTQPNLFFRPDRVYASLIFEKTRPYAHDLLRTYPDAIPGGTCWSIADTLEHHDVETLTQDSSFSPNFPFSIGFTSRGCRMRCPFCVVPRKEGRPRAVSTIAGIWRGNPWPRKLILLDNDFFGQPESQWQARIQEIREGNFRISFCQRVTVRQITPESAAALASVHYRDNEFRERILYTAWDNLGDEKVFKRGVGILNSAGIPSSHLRVYMLIGYRQDETWDEILYRFHSLVSLGCQPYPMVYGDTRPDLKAFQRWAVTGLYRAVRWEDYRDPRLIGRRVVRGLTGGGAWAIHSGFAERTGEGLDKRGGDQRGQAPFENHQLRGVDTR